MKETKVSPEAADLLREVRGVIGYHKDLGIDSYPATEELARLLQLRVGSGRTQQPARPELLAEKGNSGRHVRPRAPQAEPERERLQVQVTSLEDIRVEVESCAACALSGDRLVPTAGEGGEKPRLLIVGDWLALPPGQAPPPGCQFGIEQDRMLAKMLEAINLSRQEVFVTNVIKCGIPVEMQPKAEHLHACLSYLHRQLVTLQPAAILSMGMIATRALLDRREPLSRLRGHLHLCNCPDERKVPLVATYHPTFLLQNPEMKKATWLDLQLLARQLGSGVG